MAKKNIQLGSLAKAHEVGFVRIPAALQQTIISVYGEVGRCWLKQFPNLIKSLAKKWNFKIEKCCTNLSFNFVALVILEDGSKAILKCGVPNDEFTTEINALRIYAGEGAAKLIAADAKKGWMIEERCVAGKNLLSLKDDEKSTTIALNLMQQLWRLLTFNSPAKFPTLAKWLRGLDKLQSIQGSNANAYYFGQLSMPCLWHGGALKIKFQARIIC